MKQKISITVEDDLVGQLDGLVDHVTVRNRSQAIEQLIRKGLGTKRTAVILAGGPEAKIQLQNGEYRIAAKIGKERVIERVLRTLRENNFRDVIIIARPKVLTAVFDIVKDGSGQDVKVVYIEEKTSKGTADTLRHVQGKLQTRFLVVYGHILFDRVNIEELWQQHLNGNSVATLMLTTTSEPSEKGAVKMEGNRIVDFVQKPKASDSHLVFSPIFVGEPELLNRSGTSLEYHVFPKLAEQGLLAGHLSSEKEVHIHDASDVKTAERDMS